MWQPEPYLRRLSMLVAGLLVLLLAGGTLAQAPTEVPVRIGIILPEAPEGDSGAPGVADVAEAARMGAVMAEEEFAFNAELLGIDLGVVIATASGGEAAVQTAQRLVDEEGVFALAGGFGAEQALALSQFAEERQIPFFNIGSASDALRNEACSRYSFHVEPSAAMYLDALSGFFVRSGFRRWFYVYEDSPEGEALVERARWSLSERHFGAREVGRLAISPESADLGEALGRVRRAEPEVVLLLLEPADQLAFLEQAEAAGLTAQVTGFPYPLAQTRAFYRASAAAAPQLGSGYREAAWEATLDAYGARELNARFLARWDVPMDAPAWAAFQAVKILHEATLAAGTLAGPDLVAYLETPQAVFDIWKGIGVSFRPWDHQLRQSLFLVNINPDAQDRWELAVLVGELPALYLPRTDPVERLDQLGDLEGNSSCSF